MRNARILPLLLLALWVVSQMGTCLHWCEHREHEPADQVSARQDGPCAGCVIDPYGAVGPASTAQQVAVDHEHPHRNVLQDCPVCASQSVRALPAPAATLPGHLGVPLSRPTLWISTSFFAPSSLGARGPPSPLAIV